MSAMTRRVGFAHIRSTEAEAYMRRLQIAEVNVEGPLLATLLFVNILLGLPGAKVLPSLADDR